MHRFAYLDDINRLLNKVYSESNVNHTQANPREVCSDPGPVERKTQWV
jgi:hypothetical protein